jgi:hypothetical protein
VLASDQALFDQVVASRPGKVVVLASLRPAALDSTERLTSALSEAGLQAHVEPVVVDAAFTASRQGDTGRVAALLADAAVGHRFGADVVVLAQYSLAPAAHAVGAAVDVPVLSGPHLAAAALATAIARRT